MGSTHLFQWLTPVRVGIVHGCVLLFICTDKITDVSCILCLYLPTLPAGESRADFPPPSKRKCNPGKNCTLVLSTLYIVHTSISQLLVQSQHLRLFKLSLSNITLFCS